MAPGFDMSGKTSLYSTSRRHRLVVKTERTLPASRTCRNRTIGETTTFKAVESRFYFPQPYQGE